MNVHTVNVNSKRSDRKLCRHSKCTLNIHIVNVGRKVATVMKTRFATYKERVIIPETTFSK